MHILDVDIAVMPNKSDLILVTRVPLVKNVLTHTFVTYSAADPVHFAWKSKQTEIQLFV